MEDNREDITLKEGVYKGVAYEVRITHNDYGVLLLETMEGKRASTSGRFLYDLLTKDGLAFHADRLIGFLS